MRELGVRIPSETGIGATLCLPEAVAPESPAPALLLLSGTGADLRDGDLAVSRSDWAGLPPVPGTMRHLARHLAGAGVASLRFDRRGFGASGGTAAETGYDTDLADALTCMRWLRARPEIAPERVAVAGHSAGALNASRVCREAPEVAAVALLGALATTIEDLLRSAVARLGRVWPTLPTPRRELVVREMPDMLLRSESVERLIEAARRGQPAVVLEGHGRRLEVRTRRLRQDLGTSYAGEMRHIRRPALILHGGEDLNVDVGNALVAYQTLREAGNDAVELVILPRVDHYFLPVPADSEERVWEQISQESLRRPIAVEALDAVARWAVRVLRPPAA